MLDDEPRPIDYMAHEAGYINHHGEALETPDGDRYGDLDDVDLYPYGDTEACA